MRIARYTQEEKRIFGNNLKIYMEEKAIRPGELAKALHISPPRVSAALKGDVSDDNMELIADYLKVPLEELLKEQVQAGSLEEEQQQEKKKNGRIIGVLGVLSVLLFLALWIFGRCEVEMWEASALLQGESIGNVWKDLGRIRDGAHLFSVVVALVGGISLIATGHGKLALFWSGLALGIMVVSGYGWAFYYQQLAGYWRLGNFLEPVLLYGWYGFFVVIYGIVGWKKWRNETWPDGRMMVRFGISALLIVLLVHGGRLGVQWIRQEKDAIKIEGVSLSREDFSQVFTGDMETAKKLSECETGTPELKLSRIRMEGDRIRLVATLDTGKEQETFPIEGRLWASGWSDHWNNTIVEVENQKGRFEVLQIEVFNSETGGTLFVREDLYKNKHLSVYMKDTENMVYLFEIELPECFQEIQACNYEKVLGASKWDLINWIPDAWFRKE